MSVNDLVDIVASDSFLKSSVAAFVVVFILGMIVRPYKDLPARVGDLERSNSELRYRMLQQEQKLDLVVCFLETEASGGNPLACSR